MLLQEEKKAAGNKDLDLAEVFQVHSETKALKSSVI